MLTEPMALTGNINICILCKEFPNRFGIYSLGNPSTGSWCAVRLFYCPLPQTSIGGKPYLNGCPWTVCTWPLDSLLPAACRLTNLWRQHESSSKVCVSDGLTLSAGRRQAVLCNELLCVQGSPCPILYSHIDLGKVCYVVPWWKSDILWMNKSKNLLSWLFDNSYETNICDNGGCK